MDRPVLTKFTDGEKFTDEEKLRLLTTFDDGQKLDLLTKYPDQKKMGSLTNAGKLHLIDITLGDDEKLDLLTKFIPEKMPHLLSNFTDGETLHCSKMIQIIDFKMDENGLSLCVDTEVAGT